MVDSPGFWMRGDILLRFQLDDTVVPFEHFPQGVLFGSRVEVAHQDHRQFWDQDMLLDQADQTADLPRTRDPGGIHHLAPGILTPFPDQGGEVEVEDERIGGLFEA